MALKEKLIMNCEHATSLVEKKRDKKLDLPERFGLWVHLAYCSFCALFFEQSKILDDSAKAFADKVKTEQKAYKLNPERKAEMAENFDKELNTPK